MEKHKAIMVLGYFFQLCITILRVNLDIRDNIYIIYISL